MKTAYFPTIALLTAVSAFLSFSNKPTAKNPNYAWLEGGWLGDGLGGTSEEVWSAPSKDGTMMGVFRHHTASGELNFYEFMVLDSLGLHLKHFSADLEGWEEKTDYISFSMLSHDSSTIRMEGLVYERLSENAMVISLAMKDSLGNSRTEKFHMLRRR